MRKFEILLALCLLCILTACTKDIGKEEIQKELDELQKRNAVLVSENKELLQNQKQLTAKNQNLEERIQKLVASNAILHEKLELMERGLLDAQLNGTVYNLNVALDFTDSEFAFPVVYKAPFSRDCIYTVKNGDMIEITNLIVYETAKMNYLKAVLPDGSTGYIRYDKNPFKNGEFSKIETLIVDGKEVSVLKLKEHFYINCAYVKALPSELSENVYEVPRKEDSAEASAITADYQWVKVTVNGHEGWVQTDSLDPGRGGPIVHTPEMCVLIDFIGTGA
ncbi:MAG: hypothetical protein J6W46_05425 [Spirochaetaceae bacterium]|nr:hypothetical protein [Spirochaetaceae bacterium]